MPIEKQAFLELLKPLQAFTGKTDAFIRQVAPRWYEAFKNFSQDELTKAIYARMDASNYFPSIDDVRAILFRFRADQGGRSSAGHEKDGCRICVKGIITFFRFRYGRWWEAVGHCATCWPTHGTPLITIQDGLVNKAFKPFQKADNSSGQPVLRYQADFSRLKPVPDSRWIDPRSPEWEQFLKHGIGLLNDTQPVTAKEDISMNAVGELVESF